MYTGPHLTKKDLAFGYDTGYGVATNNTPTRFYPGKPTTNLADSSLADWGTESSAQRIATGNYYNSQPTFNCRSAVGSVWLAIYNDVTGLRTAAGSSGTVTMSVWVRNTTTSSVNVSAYMGHDFSSGRTVSANTDWQRIQWTVNRTSMNSDYCEFRPNTGDANRFLEFTMPQIEVNVTTATPFTTSSRSTTTSLLNLTKLSNIDVSNLSFDSTGQPIYDGTNDHITGTLSMNGGGAPHTIEMIFSSNSNQSSIGSRKDPFSIGNSSSHQYSALDVNTGYMNWYFYGKDTTFTNSPLMVANQFYHIVLSYAGGYSNNTNKKVWINGVQQTLSAGVNETPLMPNNPNFSVGRDRGRNTAYWPGEIPVFKVYSRALSEDQAQGNYNAYKNRFDL